MAGLGAAALVVAVLLGVGIAGWSSQDTPSAAELNESLRARPSSTAASGSATASPSASGSGSGASQPGTAVPAAARAQTEAGAEAFTRYFIDQLAIAWMEPRAGLIASLSDPKCTFCTKSEAQAKEYVAKGYQFDSRPVEVLKVEPFGGAPKNQQFLAVTFQQLPTAVVDQSGKEVDRQQGMDEELYVIVAWRQSGWQLLEIEGKE
ncbi:MAG: DUF6318 family protein [Dermatophilaceae bacterium]